ncbi:MAG: DUF3320 domain-containing protein [Alphaproteobacteria bacterium]
MNTQAIDPDLVQEPSIKILSTVASRITFASSQSDISILADLAIQNDGDETLEDLVLHLESDPSVIESRTWVIDRLLGGGASLHLTDRAVDMNRSMLEGLTERMKCRLRFRLMKGETELSRLDHEFTALAKYEWGGGDYMPSLLAAFVMPNDPAIEGILKQAAGKLKQSGTTSNLDGYQSRSRQRVWSIASAIWAAVCDLGLDYATPPASFEREGQKVRRPGHVVSSGLATCMDSALLFAAALEQAGLHPVLALTEGHIFCGVWLQPRGFSDMLVYEALDIRKCIADADLLMFETTMVAHQPPGTFRAAIDDANRQLAETEEDVFVFAMDVRQARASITPLPLISQTTTDGSAEYVAENEPAATAMDLPPDDLPAFDLGVGLEQPAQETPTTRLDHWKRKLLDLTKRNRLLNLKQTRQALPLICASPAQLEDALANGEVINFTARGEIEQANQGRDGTSYRQRMGQELLDSHATELWQRKHVLADAKDQSDLDKTLITLYRKANSDLKEGGSNTLYLSIGLLRWQQEGDQRPYYAPLVLMPVSLTRKSARSRFKLRMFEDETVFNMTLLEMLRQEFGIELPQLAGDLPTDESGVDIPAIWSIVRAAVRDIPGFEVQERMFLGSFSFAKYLLWKDLQTKTDQLMQSPLVKHLIQSPRDAYGDPVDFLSPDQVDQQIDPAELYMPLPVDSSQIVAIHASAQGSDFVLEGPPGTGKSQTIANIIAHNLALGRRVLFVAEKMAALEVVHTRLCDCGLANLSLELHSNKSNKKDVIQQLGRAWQDRSPDNPTNERNADAAKLKQLRDELNAMVKAVHQPGPSGISPYQALGRALNSTAPFRLDWEGAGLAADPITSPEAREELQDLAHRLGLAALSVTEEDRNVFDGMQQTDWSHGWRQALTDQVQQSLQASQDLRKAATALCDAIGLSLPITSLKQADALAELARTLPLAVSHDLSFALEARDLPGLTKQLGGLHKQITNYQQIAEKLTLAADHEALSRAPGQGLLARWQQAEASWFLPRFFAQKKIRTELITHLPELTGGDTGQQLSLLAEMQKLASKIERAAKDMPASIAQLRPDGDTDLLKSQVAAGRQFRTALMSLASEPEQISALKQQGVQLLNQITDLMQPGMPASDAASTLIQKSKIFHQHWQELRQMAANDHLDATDLHELEDKLDGWARLAPRLQDWCRWQATAQQAQGQHLGSLVAALNAGAIKAEEARDAFDTAYAHFLAPRLVDDRPLLRDFAPRQHEDKIASFRRIDDRLAEMTSACIRARWSEGVPSFSDTANRPKPYSVLNHELTKKMRHKPIRQLFNEMGSAVTDLAPCMLMSPLSVAQFLPPEEQVFDLVVFDEASQITPWDAVGAIARGKNVIIVGDPKQMPPTNFFQRQSSEDQLEDIEIEDMESILDEALTAQIGWHRLTGHYRSRHESLISFSNHRYYDGHLVTYPAADTRESAVSLHRLDGLYEKGGSRTNPAEAKAVVAEIKRRLTDDHLQQLSIGVVTLNSQQQKLIEDLLDDARRADPSLEPFFQERTGTEPVFVKNLESVQGDERDVILLSIGYGPSEIGNRKMSMNFGPLNRTGGERRLNVAITRARQETIVFASFDPDQIDLTRTGAAAVRDLRHYMEFAQRGPKALAEAIQSVAGEHAYDSGFEKAVADGLRKRGWNVHTQIGVSKFRIDLGVVDPANPGSYLAGIECDGATWHSSPSARDRDKVRQAVLEGLGWTLLRVWSTTFFNDPKGVLDRLSDELSEMAEQSAADADNKTPRDTALELGVSSNVEPEIEADEVDRLE